MELSRNGVEPLREGAEIEVFMQNMGHALVAQFEKENESGIRQVSSMNDAIYLEVESEGKKYRISSQEISTNHKSFVREGTTDSIRDYHYKFLSDEANYSPMFTVFIDKKSYSFAVPGDMREGNFVTNFLLKSWPDNRDKTKPGIYDYQIDSWVPENDIPDELEPLFRALDDK